MTMMKFEEFQETKVWHDDLAVLPMWQYDPRDGASPGFAYLDGQLFIDKLENGKFDLVIGNMEYVSTDLPKLERQLYQFALEEQLIERWRPAGVPGQLTWRELSALAEGTRVRFVEPHDIFPITVVDVGTVGTLVENGLNEIYATAGVLPDDEKLRHDLADWHGEISLSPDHANAETEDGWDDLSPVALEG